MKVHKLDRYELQRWRDNRPHFVLPNGSVEGPLPDGLDPLLASLVLRARQTQREVRQKIQHFGVVYDVLVTVSPAPKGSINGGVQTTLTVDGKTIVTGREVLYDALFEEHGECQVRAPNNVILKVVRDPNERRPTLADGLRLAPRPSACPCKDWGHPHPGVHHAACQYNRVAPADERAPSAVVSDAELAGSLAPVAPAPHAAAHAAAAQTVTSAPVKAPPVAEGPLPPERCRHGCLEWPTPGGRALEPGAHHPACPDAHAWAQHQSRERAMWLVDLKTGERVRRASLAEIAESDTQKRKTGVPVLHIDERPYAVVPDSELE